MTVEFARKEAVLKPWGVVDVSPWGASGDGASPVGEIRYFRSSRTGRSPSLLLKVLLTSQPLSVQVHPDDAQAHALGLPNGKTEAWYVLAAGPAAKVALGLKRHTTRQELLQAAETGAIGDLLAWRSVKAHDTIFVSAGTIHAIGADVIIAEIQQNSDVTFRLFDYGRQRDLHINNAIAVANTGPSVIHAEPRVISGERTLLVANTHFVFEKLELPARSTRWLSVSGETWLLAVDGDASVGNIGMKAGDAIYASDDSVEFHAGPNGLTALIAYVSGRPGFELLDCARNPAASHSLSNRRRESAVSRTTSLATHLGPGKDATR